MSHEQQFRELLGSTQPINVEQLHAFYDGLVPVDQAFMLGRWNGGVFNTGHPGEKQLGKLGWVGKTFHQANDVDPIVCKQADGSVAASPVMGKASLRVVEYRGVSTATMVYDNHPIFDHFKKITDTLVLGVMDKKGDEFPLYFYLERA